MSHFICDAIPHFGTSDPDTVLKSRGFRNYLIAEALICAGIVGLLAAFHPRYWLLAAFCAFFAAAPDLLSISRYKQISQNKPWKSGRYVAFASRIQWFERPIGAAVEVAWFVAALVILVPFL